MHVVIANYTSDGSFYCLCAQYMNLQTQDHYYYPV